MHLPLSITEYFLTGLQENGTTMTSMYAIPFPITVFVKLGQILSGLVKPKDKILDQFGVK